MKIQVGLKNWNLTEAMNAKPGAILKWWRWSDAENEPRLLIGNKITLEAAAKQFDSDEMSFKVWGLTLINPF